MMSGDLLLLRQNVVTNIVAPYAFHKDFKWPNDIQWSPLPDNIGSPLELSRRVVLAIFTMLSVTMSNHVKTLRLFDPTLTARDYSPFMKGVIKSLMAEKPDVAGLWKPFSDYISYVPVNRAFVLDGKILPESRAIRPVESLANNVILGIAALHFVLPKVPLVSIYGFILGEVQVHLDGDMWEQLLYTLMNGRHSMNRISEEATEERRQRFSYKKLTQNPENPSFRLIVLLPNRDSSTTIECALCQELLSGGVPYEALSYVWGDATVTERILVNGRTFFATRNLANALRGLRHCDTPRVLWVDAICINQADHAEKASQVCLMGRIYSNASSVTVWLGSETKSSALVLLALRSIVDFSWSPEDKELNLETVWSVFYTELSIEDRLLVAQTSDAMIKSLILFFQRPWWHRIWVFQEIVLARRARLQSGTSILDWDDLLPACIILYRLCSKGVGGSPESRQEPLRRDGILSQRSRMFRALHDAFHPLIVMHDCRQRRHLGRPESLEALLMLTAEFNSTDPRDRVYGVMSLVTDDSVHELLKPDYSPTTITAALYHEVGAYVLRKRQEIRYLPPDGPTSSALRNGVLCWISWIPSFRRNSFWSSLDQGRWWFTVKPLSGLDHRPRIGCADVYESRDEKPGWFNACAHPRFHVPFQFEKATRCEEDGLLLIASGISLSVVETNLPVFGFGGYEEERGYCSPSVPGPWVLPSPEDDLAAVLSVLAEWEAAILPSSPSDLPSPYCLVPHQPLSEVYWRTILANTWYDHNGCPSLIENHTLPDLSTLPPASDAEAFRLRQAVANRACPGFPAYGRRLFRTEKGIIGLGPTGMLKGDVVAVVLGARLPLVLRKLEPSFIGVEGDEESEENMRDQWQIVGESYVHGAMNGEIMERWQEGEYALRQFKIW